mmetsp:Transcript_34873/g.58374  ORF Transcript_34873/g.58374 Transcript_34873/m.58374 type:complete len:646 (+) Transcript_34873:2011-3948(+)
MQMRNVVLIMRSFVRSGVPAAPMMRCLAKWGSSHVLQCTPQELSMLAWSFGQCDARAAEEVKPLLREIVKESQRRLKHLSVRDIISLAWGATRTRSASVEDVIPFLDFVVDSVSDMRVGELCMAAHVLADFDLPYHPLLRQVIEMVNTSLDGFFALNMITQFVDLLGSLGRLNVDLTVLCDVAYKRIIGENRLKELPTADLANVARVFTAPQVHKHAPAVLDALFVALMDRPKLLETGLEPFTVSSMVWSAQLCGDQGRNKRLIKLLSEQADLRLKEYTNFEMATFCISCATLSCPSVGTFMRIGTILASRDRLMSMTPWMLSAIFYAFCSLRNDHAILLDSLAAVLQRRIGELSKRDVARLLLGMAYLGPSWTATHPAFFECVIAHASVVVHPSADAASIAMCFALTVLRETEVLFKVGPDLFKGVTLGELFRATKESHLSMLYTAIMFHPNLLPKDLLNDIRICDGGAYLRKRRSLIGRSTFVKQIAEVLDVFKPNYVIGHTIANLVIDIAYPDEKIAVYYVGWRKILRASGQLDGTTTMMDTYLKEMGWKVFYVRYTAWFMCEDKGAYLKDVLSGESSATWPLALPEREREVLIEMDGVLVADLEQADECFEGAAELEAEQGATYEGSHRAEVRGGDISRLG